MNLWQGKAFGIPFVGNFLNMMYWVKDDLEAAGLDPETIGETWDELLDIAEKLTTFDDNGNVEHLGVQSVGGWSGSAYRNGVDQYGDGTPEGVNVDDPRSLAALKYNRDMYLRQGGWDAVGAATEAWGNQQLGNPMLAGVCTILNSGVFTVNIINEQKPDLNYKIGLVPHGPDGEFTDLIVASWANCIPAKAEHPDEAWVLAKYLSAGDGHLKFMVELQARPAMVKAFNEAPHDAKAREGNPYWDTVLEILNGNQASYPVSDVLGSANSVMGEAFESVMLDVRTPEEAVSWAQEEVEKVFGEE
jgi:ABC-type glycerol-3-phosphate transport system substrate-binding protein